MTDEIMPEKAAKGEIICSRCGLKTNIHVKGLCRKCYLSDRTTVVLYSNERARLKRVGLTYRTAILESLERHERRQDAQPTEATA